MGNFGQILANSKKIFYKTTDQKSFIFGMELIQIRWPIFTILMNDLR